MSQLLVPAPPSPTRRQRMVAPVLTIGGLGLATLALHLRDPHQSGSWGFCPSAALGFWCPGCGGLRAVNDLTNGDVLAAASSNLVLVVAMPLAVLGLLLWARRRWRDAPALSARLVQPTAAVVVAVLVVFTVLRNLPAGAWLAP